MLLDFTPCAWLIIFGVIAIAANISASYSYNEISNIAIASHMFPYNYSYTLLYIATVLKGVPAL